MILVVLASTRPKQLEDLVKLCRSCTARSALRRPQPTRQRRLSPAEQTAVVQAYQAGRSMAALADEYEVRRSTISELLARDGDARRQQRSISAAEVDRAVDLYARGWSLQRVGERLGFDAETIRTHLKRRGAVLRPGGRPLGS